MWRFMVAAQDCLKRSIKFVGAESFHESYIVGVLTNNRYQVPSGNHGDLDAR